MILATESHYWGRSYECRLPIFEPVVRETGVDVGDGRAVAPAEHSSMQLILAAAEEIPEEPGGLVPRADGGPARSAQSIGETNPQAPGWTQRCLLN